MSTLLYELERCMNCVVWGWGNWFCGERICEKHPKNKQNLLLWGIKTLGGISSPKGPAKQKTKNETKKQQQKNTVCTLSSCLQKLDVFPLWGVPLMHLSATTTTCG